MTVDFFRHAARLKRISRQGWVDSGISNPESVADHSYSVAVMAMLLSDARSLDTCRVLRMALLHDLAESKVGDLTPGAMDRSKKITLETKALKEITAGLPPSIRAEYMAIWEEYVENRTDESELVHHADKIEMALQAALYAEGGHPEDEMRRFVESAESEIRDHSLNRLLKEIAGKHVREGQDDHRPSGSYRDTL